jgi:hypothetical protein
MVSSSSVNGLPACGFPASFAMTARMPVRRWPRQPAGHDVGDDAEAGDDRNLHRSTGEPFCGRRADDGTRTLS